MLRNAPQRMVSVSEFGQLSESARARVVCDLILMVLCPIYLTIHGCGHESVGLVATVGHESSCSATKCCRVFDISHGA